VHATHDALAVYRKVLPQILQGLPMYLPVPRFAASILPASMSASFGWGLDKIDATKLRVKTRPFSIRQRHGIASRTIKPRLRVEVAGAAIA
jgi:hypothetical protein